MFLCLFFIIIYVAVKMHFVVSFFIYKHVLFNIKANLTSIILALISSDLTQSVYIPLSGCSCSDNLCFCRLCCLFVFVSFMSL